MSVPAASPRTGQGRLAGLLAAVLVIASSGCWKAAKAPNILIIVADTLRADRLACYGGRPEITPFLNELCARGSVFANAYSNSSWTSPSVASLFTSRLPSQHAVANFASHLAAGEVTLAETLGAHGYGALGLTANFLVAAGLGYDQGFERWQAFATRPSDDAAKPRGSVIRTAILEWLDRDESARPHAIYAQYMEPHAPYQAPEPYSTRLGGPLSSSEAARAVNRRMLTNDFKDIRAEEVALLRSLYDAEVAALDDELRQLFAALRERGFLDNAVVVITADHGEEFREHGFMGHGLNLYNETIHVPLIFLLPGTATGRRITARVSLIDVAPTLLELAGLPPEARFTGRSLVPLLRGQAEGEEPAVLAELLPKGTAYDFRHHSRAFLSGDLKLLTAGNTGREEFFDLADDPSEEHPNPPSAAARVDVMRDRLATIVTTLKPDTESAKAVVDEATREKMRALGYAF